MILRYVEWMLLRILRPNFFLLMCDLFTWDRDRGTRLRYSRFTHRRYFYLYLRHVSQSPSQAYRMHDQLKFYLTNVRLQRTDFFALTIINSKWQKLMFTTIIRNEHCFFLHWIQWPPTTGSAHWRALLGDLRAVSRVVTGVLRPPGSAQCVQIRAVICVLKNKNKRKLQDQRNIPPKASDFWQKIFQKCSKTTFNFIYNCRNLFQIPCKKLHKSKRKG